HHVKPVIRRARTQQRPFYCGRPAQQARAPWFAGVWREQGFASGVSLRRLHYVLVSMPDPPPLHDGTPYQNTERSCYYLSDGGKAAGYLGLISPGAFVDRRNPEPTIFFQAAAPGEVSVHLTRLGPWMLPTSASDLARRLYLDVPQVEVRGYGY